MATVAARTAKRNAWAAAMTAILARRILATIARDFAKISPTPEPPATTMTSVLTVIHVKTMGAAPEPQSSAPPRINAMMQAHATPARGFVPTHRNPTATLVKTATSAAILTPAKTAVASAARISANAKTTMIVPPINATHRTAI